VLPYWIKQRPNKASFFRKEYTQSTNGGHGPWPPPGYAPVYIWEFDGTSAADLANILAGVWNWAAWIVEGLKPDASVVLGELGISRGGEFTVRKHTWSSEWLIARCDVLIVVVHGSSLSLAFNSSSAYSNVSFRVFVTRSSVPRKPKWAPQN